MKLKKGFVLCPTLGYTVVVATGELSSKFNGMIKLNETSADIWRWVEEGLERDAIVERFSQTYGVSDEIASRDVDAVINNMKETGVFEE